MKYGLVLAGGGVRGAYQIGVMRAVNELGIEISSVCGTSIGAVNGALFAQGSYEKACALWADIRICDIIKSSAQFGQRLLSISNTANIISEIKNGGLDISPLEELLDALIDEDKLRSSETDFGLVTFSLTSRKALRIFKDEIPRGKICEYIIASASLPIFKTKSIGGEKFADGGLADNLPIDLPLKRGTDNIIAVDVHGIGVKRGTDTAGVNLLEIKCKKPYTGIMDFAPEGINAAIKAGYYDAKRVFGCYGGNKYFFDICEYNALKRTYGIKLIDGLEDAAEAFGLEKLRAYGFCDFLEKTLALYEECRRRYAHSAVTAFCEESAGAAVVGLVGLLKKNKKEFLNKHLDVFGKYYNAASAVIYFGKNAGIDDIP